MTETGKNNRKKEKQHEGENMTGTGKNTWNL